jgi:hypothetical protein
MEPVKIWQVHVTVSRDGALPLMSPSTELLIARSDRVPVVAPGRMCLPRQLQHTPWWSVPTEELVIRALLYATVSQDLLVQPVRGPHVRMTALDTGSVLAWSSWREWVTLCHLARTLIMKEMKFVMFSVYDCISCVKNNIFVDVNTSSV